MGKKDTSKSIRQPSGAVQQTHANARESDSRKSDQLRSMELKRLKNRVDRQREKMASYEHPDMKKRPKMDPLYDLKGPARAAREFYKDPNYIEDIENVNLLSDYEGRVSEHEEGKVLLQAMFEYGVSLFNNFNKLKDAEGVFVEMMQLDRCDNMRARDALLRCYLDCAEGEKVRAFLDAHADERSCLFMYSRALIEHISLLIEEEGSSVEVRDLALDNAYEANPFAFWSLLHSEVFSEAVELVEEIPIGAPVGSVEEAFLFFETDIDVWADTDGVIDWLDEYATARGLAPPVATSPATATRSSAMYSGMFNTAIEMAAARTAGDA